MAGASTTRLRQGAAPDARDAELVRAYTDCQRTHADGGVRWCFGIRNADGAIYRDGVFTSFEGAMAFADRMEHFGYVLEPESAEQAQAGLHVVYVPAALAPRRQPAARHAEPA